MALELIEDKEEIQNMKNSLKKDILQNSIFYFRVFELGPEYDIYFDMEQEAGFAVQKNEALAVFTGDWQELDIPYDLLPQDGFFIHGCPIPVLEKLSDGFLIDEDWPCWKYISNGDYGRGPWDDIGRLKEDDAPFIANYWDLVDDPEDILREKIIKYDSACIREMDKPVSWVGVHWQMEEIAELGFAHTLKEQRRKGYSKLVTKALVNRMASKDKQVMVHIIKDNDASIGLSESLGFKRIGEATWIQVGKRL